jgi:polysaccharide biosynthesis/export protein
MTFAGCGAASRTRRAAGAAALLLCLLSSAGCEAPGSNRDVFVGPEYEESVKRYRIEYVLAPGDVLEVVVIDNPSVSRTSTIRPDGFITLPLLDDVKAAGLTNRELDDVLTERFSARLQKPEVSVITTQPRPAMVYVFGEVNAPVPIQHRLAPTAAQAIAYAGGFKETAARDSVIVIRLVDARLRAIRICPFASGQAAPLMALQIAQLQPDDLVFVPKSDIAQVNSWISQYINQPIQGLNTVISLYTNYKLIEFLQDDN